MAALAGGTALAADPGWTAFAFDDHTITHKSNLFLTMARAEKHSGNPVVARGPAGSPDSYRAQFYGTVIRVGGKFRMWYAACNYDPTGKPGGWSNTPNYDDTWRIAYAESDDGIAWTKPHLGLTEFGGNKRNNIVRLPDEIDAALLNPLAAFVLYEPDAPNPAHRYKMALYGKFFKLDPATSTRTFVTIYPLWSADGLRWKLAGKAPKKRAYDETEAPFTAQRIFEIGGFYKFDGIYYAIGQETAPDITMPNGDFTGRTVVTHWSGDFVRWSQERSFSFQRYGYRSGKMSQVEEAHEGASVWNRGNVLIGLYGQWHGSPERSQWRLDLGLLVSNNGVHFREPVADHVFLKHGDGSAWDRNGLLQGQGMVNFGDKTHIYYGAWDPSIGQVTHGEVGLATVERDRFGFLSTKSPGEGSLVTAPVHPPRAGASLSLNASELGGDSYLQVELTDKYGAPLPGYSGAAAATVGQSGLRTKVVWPRGRAATPPGPFRMRVRFRGTAPGKARLYAMYLD